MQVLEVVPQEALAPIPQFSAPVGPDAVATALCTMRVVADYRKARLAGEVAPMPLAELDTPGVLDCVVEAVEYRYDHAVIAVAMADMPEPSTRTRYLARELAEQQASSLEATRDWPLDPTGREELENPRESSEEPPYSFFISEGGRCLTSSQAHGERIQAGAYNELLRLCGAYAENRPFTPLELTVVWRAFWHAYRVARERATDPTRTESQRAAGGAAVRELVVTARRHGLHGLDLDRDLVTASAVQ